MYVCVYVYIYIYIYTYSPSPPCCAESDGKSLSDVSVYVYL